MRGPAGIKLFILAPLVRGRKGEYRKIFEEVAKSGFVRVRIDKKIYDINDLPRVDKKKAHSIEVVVDRLVLAPEIKKRLTDSVETALKTGGGMMVVVQEEPTGKQQESLLSERYACTQCALDYEEFQPRMFSFNSPYGACPACAGLGTKMEIDEDLVVPDRAKTLREGALEPWRRGGKGYLMYYRGLLGELADVAGFSLDIPFKKLPKHTQRLIMRGGAVQIRGKPYEGIIPYLERLFKTTDSDFLKEEINKYMSDLSCPQCQGARLRPESLAVTVGGRSIYEITHFSVSGALAFFNGLQLSERETVIIRQVIKEIKQRLEFMENVGLSYVTLDRQSSTLSGGEAQRIKLARELSKRATGKTLYILDEPTTGLHFADVEKLLAVLQRIVDKENTVLVIEHNPDVIKCADYIIDLGPEGGELGGYVVAHGSPQEVVSVRRSYTGQFLRKIIQET
jgi:excinuclease ABC subunit A